MTEKQASPRNEAAERLRNWIEATFETPSMRAVAVDYLDAALAEERSRVTEGLDVERLGWALYEQVRASYRDPRRAPPPWDVLTTRSRNTEWKPPTGGRVEHYGHLADSYRSEAQALAERYRKGPS